MKECFIHNYIGEKFCPECDDEIKAIGVMLLLFPFFPFYIVIRVVIWGFKGIYSLIKGEI